MTGRPVIAALSIMGLVLAGVIGWTVVLSGEVTSLRHQASADSSQLARDKRELAAASRLVAAQQARLGGQHRDLITCGDLQNLITDMPQTDSNADTIFYGGPNGAIPLPRHCVNQ